MKKKETNEPNEPEVVLIIPLLKEQKMDLILQKSTELGVSRIIPIIAERSIIKLDKERFNKKKERWERIVKEASEQSLRNSIPVIDNLKEIKDLGSLDGIKIVCSTIEKDINIKNILKKKCKV